MILKMMSQLYISYVSLASGRIDAAKADSISQSDKANVPVCTSTPSCLATPCAPTASGLVSSSRARFLGVTVRFFFLSSAARSSISLNLVRSILSFRFCDSSRISLSQTSPLGFMVSSSCVLIFSVTRRRVVAEGGFDNEPLPSNRSSTGESDSTWCALNDVCRYGE
jgi:hypothetical protein